MTREGWIEEFADVMVRRTGMARDKALEYGETWIDDCIDGNPAEMSPEDAVSEEISCWGE